EPVSFDEAVSNYRKAIDKSVLAGQLKNVTMRKIQEQDAIYYIGETGIANRETLVFNISITPEGSAEASELRFTREFYTN
ncbi:MAG: DUF4426 domain-containing protein, partial [Woeseiaceae bacterium]